MTCTVVCAQEAVRTSHFTRNLQFYNPAASGMSVTEANAGTVTRMQWAEFDGSPVFYGLWADFQMPSQDMALGVNINQDRLGAYRQTELLGNYAYQVPITPTTNVSLGLRAGVALLGFNTANVTNIWDDDDLFLVSSAAVQAVLPKAGFGAQIHNETYFVGLSLPDLIVYDKENVLGNEGLPFFQQKRSVIINGGYRYKLNNTYELLGSSMISYYPRTDWNAEFNAQLEIRGFSWVGVGTSTLNTYTFLAGVYLSPRVSLAYAYELIPKSQASIPLNTHELGIGMHLHGLMERKF